MLTAFLGVGATDNAKKWGARVAMKGVEVERMWRDSLHTACRATLVCPKSDCDFVADRRPQRKIGNRNRGARGNGVHNRLDLRSQYREEQIR